MQGFSNIRVSTRVSVVTIFTMGLISLAHAVGDGTTDRGRIPKDKRISTETIEALAAEPDLEISSVGNKGHASSIRGRLGKIERKSLDEIPQPTAWGPSLIKVSPAFKVNPSRLFHEKTWLDSKRNVHARFKQMINGMEVIGAGMTIHADRDGKVYAAIGNVGDDSDVPNLDKVSVNVNLARSGALKGGGTRKAATSLLVYVRSTLDREIHLAWEIRVLGYDEGGPIDELVYIDAVSGAEVDRVGLIETNLNREVSKMAFGNPPYPMPNNLFYGWPRLLYKNESGQYDSYFQTTMPNLSTEANSHWAFLSSAHSYFQTAHGRDSFDGAGRKIVSFLNGADLISPNNAFWSGSDATLNFGTGYKASFYECSVWNSAGLLVSAGKAASATSYEYYAQANGTMTYHTPSHANDGNTSDTYWTASSYAFPQTWSVDLGVSNSISRVNVSWLGYNRWMYRIETSANNSTWTTVLDKSTAVESVSTTDVTFAPISARYVRVVITGTGYSPFAADADIVTHEFAHGVTQFTSNLRYSNEPGALNEAFSDISAASAYWWNSSPRPASNSPSIWKMGEGAYTPTIPGDAFRSMNDPIVDGYSKDYYPDRITTSGDYFGVHGNSGIANLAFYLAAVGGTHPRGKTTVNVPGVGMLKAIDIFYDGFTNYLHSGSQFVDARVATVVAAQVNFPNDPSVATAIGLAWDAVGVTALDDNAHPVNFSGRADVGTGSNMIIAGFTVSGASSKQFLFRGVGPTLGAFGVSNPLVDPQITLFNSSNSAIAANNDWGSSTSNPSLAAATAQLGAFSLPDNSKDAAMLFTLGAGNYTLQLAGVGSTSGNSMVEIYDTNLALPASIKNLSTRCQVTSANQAVAGVVITGQANKRLLIRAVGPSLSNFGLTGVLIDPQLSINIGANAVFQNDNWSNDPSVVAVTNQIGQWQLNSDSKDSAIVVSLPPGSFTVNVSGVGGNIGLCLIEIYDVSGMILQ